MKRSVIIGSITCNQKVVSDKFNDYFINVAQNFLRDLGKSNTKFQDSLKDPNTNSFFLKDSRPAEVEKLV